MLSSTFNLNLQPTLIEPSRKQNIIKPCLPFRCYQQLSQMSDPMQPCENCGREFPSSKVHSHYAYCRRNIRKCRQCGQFIDINDEQQHIQQMHFRQPCQYCKKSFPKDDVAGHENSCLAKPVNCQFCELPFKGLELDEHIAVCATRTKPCGVCGKNVMLLDYDSHTTNCGKAKVPLSSIGNRRAPPQVDPKYRVERIGPVVPSPMRKQPSNEYYDHGMSEDDIETQRAIYENIQQQNRQRMHQRGW